MALPRCRYALQRKLPAERENINNSCLCMQPSAAGRSRIEPKRKIHVIQAICKAYFPTRDDVSELILGA